MVRICWCTCHRTGWSEASTAFQYNTCPKALVQLKKNTEQNKTKKKTDFRQIRLKLATYKCKPLNNTEQRKGSHFQEQAVCQHQSLWRVKLSENRKVRVLCKNGSLILCLASGQNCYFRTILERWEKKVTRFLSYTYHGNVKTLQKFGYMIWVLQWNIFC